MTDPELVWTWELAELFGFEEGSPMPVGCPLEQLDQSALIYLSMYPSYERGVLWEDGGYGSQPAIYCEAMSIVANEIAAYEARQAEEQAEASRNAGTSGLTALESPRLDSGRK